MELSSKWNSVPSGTQYQVELGTKWNSVPSGGSRYYFFHVNIIVILLLYIQPRSQGFFSLDVRRERRSPGDEVAIYNFIFVTISNFEHLILIIRINLK